MEFVHIVVLSGLALPFMWFVPSRWRPFGILVGSITTIAWLLAGDGFTPLDMMLIMATLMLVIATWWIIQPQDAVLHRDDTLSLGIIAVVLVVLWLVQAVTNADNALSLNTMMALSLSLVVATVSFRGMVVSEDKDYVVTAKRAALLLSGSIIMLLGIIKFPPLANLTGFALTWDAQSLSTASPFVWLGFSYIAFRLLALLLDFRAKRLPKTRLSLRDTVAYILFFPAFTAGPIDRAQRFIPEFQDRRTLDTSLLVEGGTRIAIGVFKKFVIADTLALVALSPELLERTQSPSGLWLLLYLYALQIFFDFSGYSDVAIGMGRLYGIMLPENFARPYIQRNIQQFWQRWHMTLSTWFRVYYFTPLSRAMITSRIRFPQPVMIFIAQVTTMLLIGLWHGITLNFFLWGLWHGIGLFVHKLLADNTRAWTKRVNSKRWSRRLMYVMSVFATFHFVALGWVFFALPDVTSSLTMLSRLFGGA